MEVTNTSEFKRYFMGHRVIRAEVACDELSQLWYWEIWAVRGRELWREAPEHFLRYVTIGYSSRRTALRALKRAYDKITELEYDIPTRTSSVSHPEGSAAEEHAARYAEPGGIDDGEEEES
jgi:hypothetical protein